MSTRFQRDIKALMSYLLIFLLAYAILAIAIELLWMPLIAWMHDYNGYLWPSTSRVYAWCKLVPFATLVSGIGVWLYERSRIGW
ncbi:hypothetical protein AXG89_21940 [Burkholderia sp. PAMC 26561]|nr:hypothetical protein AXG89_21940 [Burkholderia sp. PAMC 26561]